MTDRDENDERGTARRAPARRDTDPSVESRGEVRVDSSGAGPAETGDQPPPVVIRMPVDIRSAALSTVATLAVILVLQYAQPVLIPLIIGVLISYTLSPLVTSLARRGLPRPLGAGLAVAALVGGIGVGAYTLSDEAMEIVSNIPEAAQRIRERVNASRREPGGALAQVQEAAKEIEKTAEEATAPGKEKPPQRGVQRVEVVEPALRASDYLWLGGMSLVGFLGQFAVILFLVYFLLVTGDLYKRKLVKIAGPTLSQKKVTVQILDDINQQIESFLRVQVLTSAIVAVATGAALWWFGLEQYAIWGLLAGVFNSIPYLGPVIVTGGLGVVAFMQFDDLLRTTYVCGAAFVITTLEGFLLTPALMSRAAQMNPVAIFVGLLFWSWLWGVWGTVLAVPMLMMVKAICDHVEDLRPVGELLGE